MAFDLCFVVCVCMSCHHMLWERQKKFSFTNYIHIKSKWGSRNSKLLSFHTPVAEAMCATDAKPQLMISSEPSVTEDELKLMLRMCWEILFKNLDLDMKDRVRKIEGNPDFCCFISTKYCKSRMLPMVMDKARIRNSEYSGLNNASESLKHAMQLVIGICIN
uniref:Uncharacterized protein n=1 Tax=Lactuca sativa TaxID=4236 RepID=A0A9R1VH91_LACSA|nr:hypothetical protein LSAT_V11C500287740 [Lactuca sativa]